MSGFTTSFGEIRSLLAQPPSVRAWRRLMELFEHIDNHERAAEELVPYAATRLDSWPDDLRFLPGPLWARYLYRFYWQFRQDSYDGDWAVRWAHMKLLRTARFDATTMGDAGVEEMLAMVELCSELVRVDFEHLWPNGPDALAHIEETIWPETLRAVHFHSTCRIDVDAMEALLDALRHLPHLTSLSLSLRDHIDEQRLVAVLRDGFAGVSSLTLDVGFKSKGGLWSFLTSEEAFPALEHLTLRNQSGSYWFVPSAHAVHLPERVSLIGCDMADVEADLTSLAIATPVRALTIRDTSFGDKGGAASLSTLMGVAPTLEQLDLFDATLGQTGDFTRHRLHRLELGLGKARADALMSAYRGASPDGAQPPTLEGHHRFDLFNDGRRSPLNACPPEQWEVIGLRRNLTLSDVAPLPAPLADPDAVFANLHTLDLGYNDLTPKALEALADPRRFPALRHLNVSGNVITREAAQRLVDSGLFAQLHSLEIFDCGLAPAHITRLLRGCDPTCLTHLDVGLNIQDVDDLEVVLSPLGDAPALVSLGTAGEWSIHEVARALSDVEQVRGLRHIALLHYTGDTHFVEALVSADAELPELREVTLLIEDPDDLETWREFTSAALYHYPDGKSEYPVGSRWLSVHAAPLP